MRKIFENYGGVIAVSIAIICFIALIGLMLTGPNGGWMGSAYDGLVSGFSDKVTMSLSADGGSVDNGLSGGSAAIITNYTAEEIDANPLLYPIGKTDPYYVVAEFNEDYTEVVITKNGEASDGLMMDWKGGSTNSNHSPMVDNSSTLTKITVGNEVQNIGNYAFTHCDSVTEKVILPDGLTSVGIHAFSSSSVPSIVIPDGVKDVCNSAFALCTSLEEIVLPDSVTYLGDNVFYGCTNLTKAVISDNVNYPGWQSFYNCTSLKELTIPCSTEFSWLTTEDFYNCTNIEKIVISKGTGTMANFGNNTVVKSTPWYISNCPEIVIEEGVTNIGNYSFYNCTSIESITIPNSVTKIGAWSFMGCSGLTSVTIPNSVTTISLDAFKNCSSLTTIKGTAGSYAETWATSKGYTFVAI